MSDERPPPPPPLPLPPPYVIDAMAAMAAMPAMPAISTPKEPFPFFKLPTEIRLHVYRLLLRRDKPVLLRSKRRGAASSTSRAAGPSSPDPSIFVHQYAPPEPQSSVPHYSSRTRRRSTQRIVPGAPGPLEPLGPSVLRSLIGNVTETGPPADDPPPLPVPDLHEENVGSSNGSSDLSPGAGAGTGFTSDDLPRSPIPNDSRYRRGGKGPSPVPFPKEYEPIEPAILMTCKLVWREARPILYSENTFQIEIGTAIATLAGLHQRSRSLIRHVRLVIPSHHEILEQFTDVVRVGLRYCWGLRTFVIVLPRLFADNTAALDDDEDDDEDDFDWDVNEDDDEGDGEGQGEDEASAAAHTDIPSSTSNMPFSAFASSTAASAAVAPATPPVPPAQHTPLSALASTTSEEPPTATPAPAPASTDDEDVPNGPANIAPLDLRELIERAPRAPLSSRTVYTNAFHILRWLPHQTKVTLEGEIDEDIARVVEMHRKHGAQMSEFIPPISSRRALLGQGSIS